MSAAWPEPAVRNLTAEEIHTFREDGVMLLRGMVSDASLAYIDKGVNYVLNHPSVLAEATALLGGDGFSGDAFIWKTCHVFRNFMYYSSVARLVQQLFCSQKGRGMRPGTPSGSPLSPCVLPADESRADWSGPKPPDPVRAAEFLEIARALS